MAHISLGPYSTFAKTHQILSTETSTKRVAGYFCFSIIFSCLSQVWGSSKYDQSFGRNKASVGSKKRKKVSEVPLCGGWGRTGRLSVIPRKEDSSLESRAKDPWCQRLSTTLNRGGVKIENQKKPHLIRPSRTPNKNNNKNFCQKSLPSICASTWLSSCDFSCDFPKMLHNYIYRCLLSSW